jgi:aryl-alcohol dehydrogenase-like predicted oxidoreductase
MPAALTKAHLGDTGLEISRVGFGAWAIGGGGYDWGWGSQEDDDSIAAIHHALELGVDWIDTAAQYGFGHSEQVVGRALAGLDRRPFVFTKGGQPEGPGGPRSRACDATSLLREVHGSLERPGIDAIDLCQVHWPIPDARALRPRGAAGSSHPDTGPRGGPRPAPRRSGSSFPRFRRSPSA